MIVDFGAAETYEAAGYKAGLVASIFSLCQFVSGFVYGYLSDRYSKKYVILVGNIGTIITVLFFGFSTSFWFALVSRSLCGVLNANVSTGKAYISMISDASNQTLAFSIINMTWGLGAILGPALGGILAQPTVKYPNVFGGLWFFETFRYVLPSMCCAIVMTIGFVIGLIFLRSNRVADVPDTPNTPVELPDIEASAADESTTPVVSPVGEPDDLIEEPIEEKTQLEEMIEKPSRWQDFKKTYLNREFVVSASGYFVVVGIDIMYEELFPLFSMLRDGEGLNFSTSEIGIVQALIGAFFCALQMLYPLTARKLGHLNCMRLGFVFVFIMMATPQLKYLGQQHPAVLWTVLTIYAIIRSLLQVYGYTSVLIMINNSAYPGKAGAVNGTSHSLGCIAKVFGPVVAGPLLAWGASNGLMFPLNTNLPFILCGILAGASLVSTLFVPKTINEPRQVR
jgi:MFS family permease